MDYALMKYVAGFFIVFMLSMGALAYYLGCRKTNTPKLAGLVGLLLSVFPPLVLIYLAILVLKKDLNKTAALA